MSDEPPDRPSWPRPELVASAVLLVWWLGFVVWVAAWAIWAGR